MDRLTIKEFAAALRAGDDYCILTHRRPDGDTLGSAAALCRGLRALGKRAAVLGNPQVTEKYAPLLAGLTGSAWQGKDLIAVDVAAADMLAESACAGEIDLLLDHHGSNTGLGRRGLICPQAAATGELVYALLLELGLPLDKPTAEAIYIAVSTDTGCFRYANTTANTLRVAAACLDAGADSYEINQSIFETKRLPRLKMDAYIAEHVELFAGGKLALIAIPREAEAACGVNEDDMESVSAYARNIEGVCLAVTMRSQADGRTKLSVRSAPSYDSAALCGLFGGGGHRGAAGASLDLPQSTAREKVLEGFRRLGWMP